MQNAIERTKVLLSDWCCDELKEAAQNWLDSIGTDKQKKQEQDMLPSLRIQLLRLTECLHFYQRRRQKQSSVKKRQTRFMNMQSN